MFKIAQSTRKIVNLPIVEQTASHFDLHSFAAIEPQLDMDKVHFFKVLKMETEKKILTSPMLLVVAILNFGSMRNVLM